MSILQDARDQIAKCLNVDNINIEEARPFQSGSGCDVLDCEFTTDDTPTSGVLKIYREDFDDYSGIGVMRTAKKYIMAASELNIGDINIPRVLGYHLLEETASILSEKIDGVEWNAEIRVRAASVLGHFHNISPSRLSTEFQEIINASRPNKSRVRNGVIQFSKYLDNNHPEWRKEYPQLLREAKEIIENAEPVSSMRTLVHGDYFSKNIIPTVDGIYIVDWDLLAIGDPMWDLGFLLGVDPGIGNEESKATMKEYGKFNEIDENVLSWHRKCWDIFWRLKALTDK